MSSTTSPAPAADPAAEGAVDAAMLALAVSSRPRPPRPTALAASLALGWRALLRIKYVPEQLFDVTVFPVMMTLMFTYLFGGALAGSTGDYLQYLLPGILVMNVVMITIYTGLSLNTDIQKGIFDRFRSLPMWQPAVLVGALLADALRYLLAGGVVLVLGLLLGYRPEGGATGLLAGLALLIGFCFCMSWIWTALSMVMRTPESLMGTSMMVLFPLTFLSNVLVDPATMPGWLQAAVGVNPITLLVTAVRGLVAGTPDAGDIGIVVAVGAGMVAVFGPLSMVLFRRPR